MRILSGNIFLLGRILLVLTVASVAIAVVRRRDLHRLDILFVVGALSFQFLRPIVLSVNNPWVNWVFLAVVLSTPHLLLRLVRHFRDVRPWLLHGSLLVAVAAAAVLTIGFVREPRLLWPATSATLAALGAVSAVAFLRETTRTSGVTARRLWFAGIGTTAFVLAFASSAVAGVVQAWAAPLGPLNMTLEGIMYSCYFFAFTTPRFVKSRWQRTEQSKYLSAMADHDAEGRGASAAADLERAAASSVGNALTIVALRPDPRAPRLAVRATSDEKLFGLGVGAERGLVAAACTTGERTSGSVGECDPELGDRLRAYGSTVLVAPVKSSSHTWGVVLVVQRRGSLFPEDDLVLLAQLARYAAVALDHAHLIAEQRERDRRSADRRLREVESRMSLMLDSIKDYAMFVMDDSGRVVTWHTGAAHVFGYSTEEMNDESAAPLYGMTTAELAGLLETARRTGLAERDGFCRRRDGGRFTGTTSIRPLEDDDLRGFVAVTRDVTEQRNLEDRLRQGQKMEAIGQLAGGIAHDFNNQLTAIMGYAEFLGHGLPADDGATQPLQQIQKAAERAAALTRQLLAFSRRQMLQPIVIDLPRLVEDLLPMLRRVIGEHISIAHTAAPGQLLVRGDRSQLEQVVVNLAVNARDAMPIGGALTITTSSVWLDDATAARDALPGAYALLEVADTGVGMDASTQSRIFEPFFTTKEFGRGTGLGLATVYGIVQQMGGLVRVMSQKGDGATFRLYFPEASGQETKAPCPEAVQAAPAGTETVLLVEDEDAVRAFLVRTLEQHGYRVIAADHQAAALARAQAHLDPIDLVITDVVMPGGTGPELVKALEAIRPGVPTLYISGYADAVLAQRGIVPKASHFLQKPFSAMDLLVRVNHILSRQ